MDDVQKARLKLRAAAASGATVPGQPITKFPEGGVPADVVEQLKAAARGERAPEAARDVVESIRAAARGERVPQAATDALEQLRAAARR